MNLSDVLKGEKNKHKDKCSEQSRHFFVDAHLSR